jgi:hypothetical protein
MGMMRRALLALFLVSVASSASAAWYPSLETGAILLEVGETQNVGVRAIWTGLMIVPWQPWVFASTNPSVATVSGEMLDSRPGQMRITALRPGRADGIILGWTNYYRVEVTVVCGRENAVQAAPSRQTAVVGVPISLHAVTPIAERTTFTWYHGRVGDTSFPISQSGADVVYVTDDAGPHFVWVLATTPCSSSTAEFQIDAVNPRRRGARH